MGVRTLAEFRFRLNRALRQAGGEKEQEGNELLDQWINEAVLEIPAIIDLESRRSTATVPTVVDQVAYVLDTTLVGLLMVKDNTNKRKLIKLATENFYLKDPAARGVPIHYTRVDRDLLVWPTPSAVYTLEYLFIAEPPVMTAGSDVTEYPKAYDRAVHLLAQRNAFEDIGEEDKATRRYQTAINYLRNLPTPSDLEGNTLQGGIEMPGSWEEMSDFQ